MKKLELLLALPPARLVMNAKAILLVRAYPVLLFRSPDFIIELEKKYIYINHVKRWKDKLKWFRWP